MTEILLKNGIYELRTDGVAYGRIIPCEGATDTFIPIENGAWKWIRKTEVPTDHMRMELVLYGEPDFTMVPWKGSPQKCRCKVRGFSSSGKMITCLRPSSVWYREQALLSLGLAMRATLICSFSE